MHFIMIMMMMMIIIIIKRILLECHRVKITSKTQSLCQLVYTMAMFCIVF